MALLAALHALCVFKGAALVMPRCGSTAELQNRNILVTLIWVNEV